jgi:hypothetical protein
MKARFLVAAAALLGVATMMVIACSSDKKGSLLVAVDTDVNVPVDVNAMGLQIQVDGVVKYSNIFAVDPAKHEVTLPATIAIVEPDSGTPSVTIRAAAFKDGKARIIRDVISTVPHRRTALLRMPLHFLGLDDGVTGSVPTDQIHSLGTFHFDTIHIDDAPTGTGATDLFFNLDARCSFSKQQTNIDGLCADSHIDSATLPDYPNQAAYAVTATGPPTCFDTEDCFSSAYAENATLDKNACTFAAPADVSHLNVAMLTNGAGFCSNGSCLVPLDADALHGYSLVGGPGNGLIRLPPGVCADKNVLGVVYSVNPSWSPKSADLEIDGAGAQCAPDDGSAGGGGASDGGDASSDASALDAADAASTLGPADFSVPKPVSVAFYNGRVFVGTSDSSVYMFDSTTKAALGKVQDIFNGTNVDAGNTNGMTLNAADNWVTLAIFPAQGTAAQLAYLPDGGLSRAGFLLPGETPANVLDTLQLQSEIWFSMASSTGPTAPSQFVYSGSPLLMNGAMPVYGNPSVTNVGMFMRAYATDNTQLWGVWDDGAGSNIGALLITPDQVNASWVQLGSWSTTTTALAVVTVQGDAMNERLVVLAVDSTKKTGSIFWLDAINGSTPNVIANGIDIFRNDQQFNLASDSRGYVYYATNSGVIYYADVFGGGAPKVVPIGGTAKNVRSVAVDESVKPGFLYYTVDDGIAQNTGVKRVQLP